MGHFSIKTLGTKTVWLKNKHVNCCFITSNLKIFGKTRYQ